MPDKTTFIQTNEVKSRKLTSILLASIFASSCLHALAQEAIPDHTLEYRAAENFTALNGVAIWNFENEKLGTIEFLTADLENARLVEVVVKTPGGFLGLGGKKTAVAPRALVFNFNDPDKHFIHLEVSKERFRLAPVFDKSHMKLDTQNDRVAEVNRYYGVEPWFFVRGKKAIRDAQILKLGHIEKPDDMIGLPVTNLKGEYLGSVNALLYDLAAGQIVHVIVANPNNTSPRNVIQARALRFNSKYNGLILDDSKTEFSGEPHFKWDKANNSKFSEESYVNRDVAADSSFHSKQNQQPGAAQNEASMEQGKSFRDEQKTFKIKADIQADGALSTTAKNVEVVTLNAQTTLRGNVTSLEEKVRIEDIAKGSGRPENVSNLLNIISAPVSSKQ